MPALQMLESRETQSKQITDMKEKRVSKVKFFSLHFLFHMSPFIIYSRWSSLLLDHQTDVYFLGKCEMKASIGGIVIDISFLAEPTAAS